MNTAEWIDATKELPDDDTCVLVSLADGEVWLGYHDGDDGWRDVSSDPLGVRVQHWMHLPDPPGKERPDFLSQALNEGDGVYRP